MIIVAKLIMPDFEQGLEMKALEWEISQAANEGLEHGRPKLRDIRFRFYDSKLMPYFFDWAKSSNSKRSGKIEYISSDMGKVSTASVSKMPYALSAIYILLRTKSFPCFVR